jgi:hypothetical protein
MGGRAVAAALVMAGSFRVVVGFRWLALSVAAWCCAGSRTLAKCTISPESDLCG